MKELFPFYSIGHFINQPANPTQFEITHFEQMQEPDVEDPHKHTFYEIIWVEKGFTRQVIDYQEYRIAPQSLFFISPGQLHHFEEWQALEGGSILFTEEFFLFNQQDKDKLFELIFLDNFYHNPFLQPDPASYTEIVHTIHLISRENKRPDRSAGILQAQLHVLLGQIQRCIDTQMGEKAIAKKYMVLYKKFKQLIDQHYAENFTVSHYADRLFVTQHHLNHVTRQVTGKTATQVIRERSMLEAKRLLTFTDYPVSEIASLLHYFDGSYFTRLFKAETGFSPLRFRSEISGKYQKR